MSEAERAQALRSIQLELFQLKRAIPDWRDKRREAERKRLRRQFRLIHGMGQKRCRKCKEVMSVDQFYKDLSRPDGYYPYCRECQIAKVTRKGNVISRGVAA